MKEGLIEQRQYRVLPTRCNVRRHFGWRAIGLPSEFYPLERVEHSYAIKSN